MREKEQEMIIGVIFPGGVPFAPGEDIEKEATLLVRSGQGRNLFFLPEIPYDLTPSARQGQETCIVRAFSNGRGVYQRITSEKSVELRMPEDGSILIIAHQLEKETLLVGVLWYLDFIALIEEGQRKRIGCPQCLIFSDN